MNYKIRSLKKVQTTIANRITVSKAQFNIVENVLSKNDPQSI